mmetsp:Transcript_2452/g.7378  ORF Transcript_2452/g.7378 Transcript_2452/m.7378 type:complete len:81 (-) Transcript_2452:1481-1723(-)
MQAKFCMPSAFEHGAPREKLMQSTSGHETTAPAESCGRSDRADADLRGRSPTLAPAKAREPQTLAKRRSAPAGAATPARQ